MKLIPDMIKEWEMFNGEDFYVDGPLTIEMLDLMLEPFLDALFEKVPDLVYGAKEDIESIYDLEFEEGTQSEENLNKIGAIFCEVIDNLGFSEKLFEIIKADFLEDLQESIDEDSTERIEYMQEDAPIWYKIIK